MVKCTMLGSNPNTQLFKLCSGPGCIRYILWARFEIYPRPTRARNRAQAQVLSVFSSTVYNPALSGAKIAAYCDQTQHRIFLHCFTLNSNIKLVFRNTISVSVNRLILCSNTLSLLMKEQLEEVILDFLGFFQFQCEYLIFLHLSIESSGFRFMF